MDRILRAAAAAWIGFALMAPVNAGAQTSGQGAGAQDPKWGEAAVSFLTKMNTGDFAGAAAMAAPSVASYFTADKMGPIWQQITGGSAVSQMTAKAVTAVGALHAVDVAMSIGTNAATVRVALDDALKVNGMFMLPSAPPPYNMPAYVDTTKFEEKRVRLQAGSVQLPGVLTLPKGVEHAPVVVLVHGSGPNDMDEAIGPNRPFKDIAWGLASRGIAVLRYDKRTKVAPSLASGATVEQEVILDALTALDSARSNSRIDAKRVYLLGHSLGAMLASEIATRDKRLAGVLVLAGTPRQLAPVILEQYAYLKTLPANASPEAQKIMADAEHDLSRLIRAEPKPEESVLGAPASYFYDLNARDAMKYAKSLKLPMLFLQGARDYQVTTTDLDLWKSGLGGHRNVSFKLYPDLNHLFMVGTGKATPAEYAVAGHVKLEVIDDLAAFIRR